MSEIMHNGHALPFDAKTAARTLACVCAWAALAVNAVGAETRLPKNVLILHSYHHGSPWTREIMRGMTDVFSRDDAGARIQVEYLDTKRHYDSEYLASLHELLVRKFQHEAFDIVLLSDNEALEFALRHRDELFPGVPIVFCGINNFTRAVLHGHTDITGVSEEPSFLGTLDTALRLHRSADKVVVVSRTSTVTGKIKREAVASIAPRFKGRATFEFWDDVPLEILVERVKLLDDDTIVLVNSYVEDKKGRTLHLAEGWRALSDICDVPVYSVWDFALGLGVVGGKLINGHDQGRMAAELALRVLRGEDPDTIPVIKGDSNRFMFDYHELQRFGVRIDELPDGALIVNQPPSFYMVNKRYIWAGVAVIVVLATIVAVLAVSFYARRKAEDKLRQSKDRLALALESAGEGLWDWNLETGETHWDDGYYAMLGYTPDALAPTFEAWKDLIHPDDLDRAVRTCHSTIDKIGQGYAVEYRMRTKAGEWRWILDRGKVVERDAHGKALRMIGVHMDVTDRKNLECELERATKTAEQASKAKSAFLANMSHEIRTPMNGVIGAAELLDDTRLTPEQREYSSTIIRSGAALLDIINQILDISKIEAGKLELRSMPFDLQTVVEDVVHELAVRADDKGIALISRYAPGTPRHCMGDHMRVRQVLANLIANAVKFTDTGHVLADVRYAKHANDGAAFEIRVVDTGIGIPADRHEAVFDDFTQVDTSMTRRPGGTGLGLSITNQIVELMGGTISVTSRENQGSTFRVVLPLPVAFELEQPHGNVELANTRILVVDSNETRRGVITECLSVAGASCSATSSAAEALRMLREACADGTPYEIAVLDHRAADMDTEAFVMAVKRSKDLAPTVLVMLMDITGRSDEAQLKRAGVNLFLAKPVRTSALCSELVAAWKGRGRGVTSTQDKAETPTDELSPHGEIHMRALVVEDNITNQEVAVLVLRKLGCETDTARNGEEALEHLKARNYDIVFMDCRMPLIDGYEATKRIREPESDVLDHDIPVVAMTAHALTGDREKCIEAGMNDYLPKPIRLSTVKAILSKWCKPG